MSWSIPLVTLSVSASAHVVSVDKTRKDKIKRQDRSRPEQTRPEQTQTRTDTSYADLALSSDDEDSLFSSDDADTSFSPVCSPLSMSTNPFSELSAHPAPVSAYCVSYDLAGLPVTGPLPFTPHVLTNPSPAIPINPYPSSSLGAVSALLPSSPLMADSGCTGLLVQLSNFSARAPFLSCKPLPSVPFTLPDDSSLQVGGPSHLTGSLTFPHKHSPVSCYFLPASDLFHSLFGVSPLIRPHGHAIFINLSCSFFHSPALPS